MESRVAQQSREALLETMRRMSPEERLNAFLEHCQRIMELYHAGQEQRARASRAPRED
jgi:hypothetical protein